MGHLVYTAAKLRNPVDSTVKYYPRLKRYSLLSAEHVVDRASENSNIDRGLLEAVMVGFQEACRNFIMNGHNLQLFPLGSFCVSLRSVRGQDTAAAVSAADIDCANLWFRSSPTLNSAKARQNLHITRVDDTTTEDEGGDDEGEGN